LKEIATPQVECGKLLVSGVDMKDNVVIDGTISGAIRNGLEESVETVWPPIEEAFIRLTRLAEEPPELTRGKLTGKIIPRAGFVIGPYGY